MIIYEVPNAQGEKETFDAIAEQNFEGEDRQKFLKQAKLAFKTGQKNKENSNWILEVSRELREILIKKERLYIGWRCCKAHDYVVATRCYKCQGYGHTSKYCRSSADTCGHLNALKIAQLNMRRAQTVTLAINRAIDNGNFDILLMQEPYNPKGKYIGFGRGNRSKPNRHTVRRCRCFRQRLVAERNTSSETETMPETHI
ncbi:hypothetical protein WH47_08616 [Habropoda laboriosa]|uniref:CCHC-type domain-containing protein n=1 Tax=Habropoda laboriosa TaxID=597456 RepID=A0A0L7QIX5_9HYME|nr:hypothetical protein WH47_08616 [Habropoda laboriosa]